MIKKSFFIIAGLLAVGCLLACTSNTKPSSKSSYDQTETLVFNNAYGISGKRLREEQFSPPSAHPTVTIKTINVYAKDQKIVKFSDLFLNQEKALQILAAYCQEYFIAQLEQENLPEENKKFRQQLIRSGTAPKLENYQHWNIKPNYLQITFDRAQVEPSYFGIQTVDVPLSLLANQLNPMIFPNIFTLQLGDLLFQDLACGELCDGINDTTYGYNNTTVSHVGMVVSIDGIEPTIIEAVSTGVQLISLDKFLLASQDSLGHPRVMVGRVNDQTKPLIPEAIKKAENYLHYSYNPTFSPNTKGFYCSQLIIESFFEANHNHPVFLTYPMNFKAKNNRYPAAWMHYFEKLNQPIPQGEQGSNPGELSRDPRVKIVYFYGDLRT